jgi:hypothetical protein
MFKIFKIDWLQVQVAKEKNDVEMQLGMLQQS